MSEENKVFWKSFFLYGAMYSGLMAWWRYSEGQDFDTPRTLIHFFVFGFVMALITRHYHIKQRKKDAKGEE
jgi:hypothetical protein